jgi:hypothetical protein
VPDDLSIYGHDKATDPRYAPIDGRVPVGVIGYYPCCETIDEPCDKVAFLLPDGSSVEMLLGRIDSAWPRWLWRREGFARPRGVKLVSLQAVLPCTRCPTEPHEVWTWRWAPDRLAPIKRLVRALRRRMRGADKERPND